MPKLENRSYRARVRARQAAMAVRVLARLADLIDLDAENSPNFSVWSSCIFSTWRCLLCSIRTALAWSWRSFNNFDAELLMTKCSMPAISSSDILLFLSRHLKESFVEAPGVVSMSRLIRIASDNVSEPKFLRSVLVYDLFLTYSGSGQ